MKINKAKNKLSKKANKLDKLLSVLIKGEGKSLKKSLLKGGWHCRSVNLRTAWTFERIYDNPKP